MSTPILRLSAPPGAENRNSMSRSVNSSSACCRIRRVRSMRLSRFGLIAQTMSLIELTDSRAIRAMDASGPTSCVWLATSARTRDPREIRSDVVVEIGGNPDPHVDHLQQPCDAVPVHRVRHRSGGGGDEHQGPPAKPQWGQDREIDGGSMCADDPVRVHRPDSESVSTRCQAGVRDGAMLVWRAPVRVGPFQPVLISQDFTGPEAEADEVDL